MKAYTRITQVEYFPIEEKYFEEIRKIRGCFSFNELREKDILVGIHTSFHTGFLTPKVGDFIVKDENGRVKAYTQEEFYKRFMPQLEVELKD